MRLKHCKALLGQGIEVSRQDLNGKTALELAIISYESEAVKLLLDRDDLDPNHPNNRPEEACRVEQQTDLPDDVFLQSFEMV